MDGVISKKQHIKNTSQKMCDDVDFGVSKEEGFDNDNYHILKLGKVYDSNEIHISHSDFENDINIQEGYHIGTQAYNVVHHTIPEFDTQEPSEDLSSQVDHNDYYGVKSQSIEDDLEGKNEEVELVSSDAEDSFEDEESRMSFSVGDLPIFSHESILLSQRISTQFAIVVGIMTVTLGLFLFVGTSFAVKERVDGAGKRAITSMKIAADSLANSDFRAAGDGIDSAYQEFVFASEEMDKIGGFATFISQFIPGASKLASGNHIVEAGKYLTHSATELYSIVPAVIEKDNPLVSDDGTHVSFLALYQMLADHMVVVHEDVKLATKHISAVYLDDVPEEYQDTFIQMQESLPLIESSLQSVVESRGAVEELLGANGQRTYLFLFQNNHEMRATGGFIGSYGILKIKDGRIEKLVVDDIFNPDGQLTDRIVPPLPIQKISANWSLHDSNWFVDFPVSARKAIDFYERTGGPTVDGVIAITPTMMEKFLDITGPIALSQYDMILTSENFMEVTQNEVEDEENYEKEQKQSEIIDENDSDIVVADANSGEESEGAEEEQKQPKKVLSDLMPIMIDRLSDRKSPEHLAKLLSAVSSGFKERHIVMYMADDNVQSIIEDNGWSGSVLQTDRDYLSVVNTNINGFKTDGVIDETISHTAQIDENGYIVNTVKIKRVHNGGKTGFPWWDAVNSDYMRVYVPKGSQLISVEGHTREINSERLDYDVLGYERDVDVEKEENGMYIDEETGTRIYEEYNKTVFANWTYVSPQESAIITYKYRLPFRTDFDSDENGEFGSYAILFQKQIGSENSEIESSIILHDNFVGKWHSQGDIQTMSMENNLITDRYHGVVFRVNE